MRHSLAWIVAAPLLGGGALGAHALAYRLTGTRPGEMHGYLAHAPLALAVLGTVALVALALAARARVPAAWPFPAAALVTFVLQEHVERLAHTGELPMLAGEPVFLLGVALQVPVALVAWAIARRLLACAVAARRRTPPAIPTLLLPLRSSPAAPLASGRVAVARGRSPPPPTS